MLNWFERLIRLRKDLPEIGWGTCTVLDTGTRSVLALRHDWQERTVITLHNLARRAAIATIDIPDADGAPLEELLLDDAPHVAVRRDRARIRLGPHEQRWLRLDRRMARTPRR
jgi:maltose alpha-D-glucosyltransferase/alpha-amylase